MSTRNDKAVLNSILNPLVPIGEDIEDEEGINEDLETATEEIKRLETAGVEQAERGDFNAAVELFSQV